MSSASLIDEFDSQMGNQAAPVQQVPQSPVDLIDQFDRQQENSPAVVKEKLSQALAAQKESSMENIVGKESSFDRFMMGGAAGITNMINNMGNIVGLVDDETVLSEQGLLDPYTKTTAGKWGEFGGEMTALAPLGFIGKGAQTVNALTKAGSTLKFLTNPWATAAVEGAGAGAIMSDPNERESGAYKGAAFGVLLNKTMAVLSRIGKDGIAKLNPMAEDLAAMVHKKTGREPFIPLIQRAVGEGADAPTAGIKGVMDFVSMLPAARTKMQKQAKDFKDDVYETNLRQVFGSKKADEANRVFRESGDMQMAVEAGKNIGAKKVFTPTQRVLDKATRSAQDIQGRYTPKGLKQAAVKSVDGDIAHAPMRDTAIKMDSVISKQIGASDVSSRDIFHRVQRILGGALNAIPGLASFLGSQKFQNFLMGNNSAQLALKEALATGSGKKVRAVISAIRRTMGAQPAQNSGGIQENMLDYADQAKKSVRGFM